VNIYEFLHNHAVECVLNAFKEKKQNVVILGTDSRGTFIVLDSPEYDYMFHRVTILVQINLMHPLSGFIRLQWPGQKGNVPGTPLAEYSTAEFGQHKSLGEAFERIQNYIWERIEE